MKKCFIYLCLFTLTISLCACSFLSGFFKSDDQIAKEKLDAVLQALEIEDSEALKKLFSPKAISESDNFENDLQALFDYFDGVTVSVGEYSPLHVSKKRDEDLERKIIYSTYDIQTDKQTYRIAMQDIIYNTYEENNVGIYSLYIIIMSEDTDPTYAYNGDGKYTPGINIGIKNIIHH